MERHSIGSGGGTRLRGKGRLVAVIAVGAVAALVIGLRTDAGSRLAPSWMKWGTQAGERPARIERVVPPGARIKVEVLNASDSRGAARAATFLLRDAGFDVVYFGNSSERYDSTLVRDRTGHAEWAALAQGVMAPASAEVSPDSTRLVDLTILIGSLWRVPSEPFRP